MEAWIEKALSTWSESETKLNPPASQNALSSAEAFLDYTFPSDFKALYLTANGFEDYEWQQHMFSFWSLERIIEESAQFKDQDFIGFCDFLICSSFIGFHKNRPGIYKYYDHIDEYPIADSFAEAVRKINISDNSIY
ncbi:SMI1/KNR4 family protein [Mucilaginibacter yixingensis]|nr:SMI1/KNR4 family protein [Mucilaginibacter yixingensis]